MSVLAVGQSWTSEDGEEDVIVSIDEGTWYPVQYRMHGGSLGRDTVDGFLDTHTKPTRWWLALMAGAK